MGRIQGQVEARPGTTSEELPDLPAERGLRLFEEEVGRIAQSLGCPFKLMTPTAKTRPKGIEAAPGEMRPV